MAFVVALRLAQDLSLDVNVGIRKGPVERPVIYGVVEPFQRQMQDILPNVDHKQKDKGDEDGQEWIGRKNLQKGPSDLWQENGSKGHFWWLCLCFLVVASVPMDINIEGQNIGRCSKKQFGWYQKHIGRDT